MFKRVVKATMRQNPAVEITNGVSVTLSNEVALLICLCNRHWTCTPFYEMREKERTTSPRPGCGAVSLTDVNTVNEDCESRCGSPHAL